MNNNRVIGLDLFRIVMMFGICLIHTCGQGEYRSAILHNMTTPCVVGFAMLSGYFGLKFSISKVVRLYSMAVAYCFLIPLVGNGFSAISGEGYFDAVLKAWGSPWRYWYLHAYIALLCISPALRTDKFGIKQPFVLVVFIWGFMLSYRTFSSIVPKAAGFGSHTFVTLLGIYIVSRIAKERLWFERMTVPVAAIGIAVAMVDREDYFLIQAPDAYRFKLLRQYFNPDHPNGHPAVQLPDSAKGYNAFYDGRIFKVTHPDDIKIVEVLI